MDSTETFYFKQRDIVVEFLKNIQDKANSYENSYKNTITPQSGHILKQLKSERIYSDTIKFCLDRKSEIERALELITCDDEVVVEDCEKKVVSYITSACKIIREEKKQMDGSSNTSFFMSEQIQSTQNKLNEEKSKLRKIKSSFGKQSVEYANQLGVVNSLAQELKEYKRHKGDRESKDDKNEDLKERIEPFKTEMNASISDLQSEQTRLNVLFVAYAVIVVLILFALIGWEVYLLFWKYDPAVFTNIINYVPFYLPVPLIGFLLWAFITQLNRTQRQLIVLANQLHKIKYTDGLLTSLSTISIEPQVNEDRVSKIINHILDSYLASDSDSIEKVLKEEKDVPIDKKQLGIIPEVTELIKTIKG